MIPPGNVDHDLGSFSDPTIRLEQVQLLYGSREILLINLVNAPIVAAVLWRIYPAWLLLSWIGFFVIVIAARVLLLRKFHNKQLDVQEAEGWARSFALGSSATGCLWGLLASVVFRTADPSYYLFVTFVLGGMVAGAALRDSVYLPAFYGFAISAVLPMVAALMVKGGFHLDAMGLLLTAFTVVLLLVGRDNNTWITKGIRAKIEVELIASNLKKVIADHDQAVAKLEESTARVHAIGESAQDAIVMTDPNGDVSYWNAAGERIFGYASDEVIGRCYHKIMVPERLREKAMEGYKRFAETGEGPVVGKTLELVALRKDGSEFPVELSVSALRLGDTWHSVGIARDVSERKRVEELLRESARYNRSLIEASLDPMATINPDGKITDVNEAMVRTTGVAREVMIGSDYYSYASEPEKARAGFQDVFTKGSLTDYPLALLHTTSARTDLLFSATLYRDQRGEVAGVFVAARDVTERKLIEDSLRKREAELEEAQHVAQVGSWEWLPEANGPNWSAELYRIFGRDPALPAPSLQEHTEIIKPESLSLWSAAFAKLQRNGTPYELDLEVVRADGTTGWIAARGNADRSQTGRIERLHGTAQDITTRKLAEQNIAALHQQLAAELEEQQKHEQDLTSIAKLSDILQACHSREEAYPVIVATANNLFPKTNGALSIISSGTHELETVAQWGADQLMLPAFDLDDCWALRTGQKYEVNCPGAAIPCQHFRSTPCGPYVCLPLTVYGETTGLLHLNMVEGDGVDDDLQRLILTFGDVVKLSLSNLRLRESLTEQALRDQLTTLYNRHYLVETLPRELRRAERNERPLSVAMLDIDHFKDFNDTRGHDAGDVVLKEVGAILRGSMRAGDIACRYGGEEFVLILPECDLNDARTRLQQICLEIKQKTFTFHGLALPSVTVSAGLSQVGGDCTSADAIITAADSALYVAKHNGRDRIEIFSGEIHQTEPTSVGIA